LNRIPIAIFLMAILSLGIISYVIIYSALKTHARGDYFELETEYVELDFPRNWVAMTWKDLNRSGNRYGLILTPMDLRASVFLMMYDENATKVYLKQNSIYDAFSSITFEVERIYNWSLEKNKDARLDFVKNGTLNVSNHQANFTMFTIEGGYIDENQQRYNWTWMYISWIDDKLWQIALQGEEADWNKAYDNFNYLLNSTETRWKK